MITYEPMLPEDVLSLDLANLDHKSENFSFRYYLKYLLDHPLDFFTARTMYEMGPATTNMIYTAPILGYVFGKREVKEKLCLHLSGLSVCPSHRKFKIGTCLMRMFETNGNSYNAWFVDLFVRESNRVAISFYNKAGYTIHRSIYGYYCYPSENAFDMRKSLDMDPDKKLQKPGKNVSASQI